MKFSTILAVLAGGFGVFAGCTSSNPRSCTDGLCTDQAYPFCDVDGTLGGQPKECIAVTCTPMAFAACRGDSELRCNETGNNYEQRVCPAGCSDAAGGCVVVPTGCETNAQCANPLPVCSSQHTCRACAADDECSSTVCDVGSGSCVPESMLVYASPTGAASGSCGVAAPCSLARAITLATAATVTPTIKLFPGDYTTSLDISSAITLQVLGTGARFIGGAHVSVSAGTVDIRGIKIVSGQLACGAASATAPVPVLTMHGAEVSGTVNVSNGNLRVDTSTFTGVDAFINVAGDIGGGQGRATFYADRSTFVGLPGSLKTARVETSGKNLDIRITNSVLRETTVGLRTSTTFAGNKIDLAFNTFVFTADDGSGGLACGSGGTFAQEGVLEDNVIVNVPGMNAVSGTTCTVTHNVLTPQSPALTGNIVADPQFVDVAANNLHLKVTSPARDAAVPSPSLVLDHDFDGIARPQGTAADIGAFEYKP